MGFVTITSYFDPFVSVVNLLLDFCFSFNPLGFLHAHISYLDEDCAACLVLLSADRDSFFALSDARNKVLAKLKRYVVVHIPSYQMILAHHHVANT